MLSMDKHNGKCREKVVPPVLNNYTNFWLCMRVIKQGVNKGNKKNINYTEQQNFQV